MSDVAVIDAIPSTPAPDDPHVRARERLARLTRSFADVLTVVGEMERDEDWKYLERADGTPYTSLRAVIEDVMAISSAMARRYIQGARGLYLPLSGVVVEGTTISVTAADVADLGDEGMATVVDEASERLTDVDDPDEASRIITDTIADTRKRRDDADDDFDEDFDDDGMTSSPRTASSPGGPAGRADEPGSDFSADYADLEASSPDDEGGNDDQIDLVDPAARVMEGASTYLTADEQDDLDEPLRSITAAIATLAQADPETLARAIDYDHRGVLEPIGDAVRNVTRMRVLVETSPWFLARLGI